MKKNFIALLLAVVMASGSIGAVPVLAAETTVQDETIVESAEEVEKEAVVASEEDEDADTNETVEKASEAQTEEETSDETEGDTGLTDMVSSEGESAQEAEAEIEMMPEESMDEDVSAAEETGTSATTADTEEVVITEEDEDTTTSKEALFGPNYSTTTWVPINSIGQVIDSITYRGITVNAVYRPRYDGIDTDTTYCCAAFVKRFYSQVYGIDVSNLWATDSVPAASSGYFYETGTPVKGDVVRYNNEAHWAIVKNVSGTTVTLIHQNAWDLSFTKGQVGTTIQTTDSSVTFFRYSGYLPDVEIIAPSYNNISINKTSFNLTDTITISSSSNNNPTRYLLVVYGKDGQAKVMDSDNPTKQFLASELGVGTYTAYIMSENLAGHCDSEYITFTVNSAFKYGIDTIKGGIETVTVSGWAYDPKDISKNLEIHIYVGAPAGEGVERHITVANVVNIPDLLVDRKRASHHFKITFEKSMKEFANDSLPYSIYVYAVDSTNGYTELLENKTVSVEKNIPPAGILVNCEGGTGTVYVHGYAMDFNNIDMKYQAVVYVGAPAGEGGERHVVSEESPKAASTESPHYFEINFSTSKTGTQNIYLYAIDFPTGEEVLTGTGTVTIKKKEDISKTVITLDKTEYTYDGSAKKPVVKSAKLGNVTLIEGTDYTVSYKNNINAGIATISINGIGDYSGTATKSFTITPKPVSGLTISGITAKTYTGKAQTQAVVVKDGTTTLVKGTDYTLAYKNNTNAGTASVVITGKGNYTSSVTKTFTIKKAANTITAKNFVKTYSATAQTFALEAKIKNGTPKYASSSTSVTVNAKGVVTVKAKFIGKATITITAPEKTNYSKQTKKITITVNPTKTALSSVTSPSAGKMTVKWKKNAVGTGYQIQYSTSSKFTSPKAVSVTKNTTLTKTIGSLAKGKKYYVRIRTYKTVGKTKFYSGWSAAKTVTIKK